MCGGTTYKTTWSGEVHGKHSNSIFGKHCETKHTTSVGWAQPPEPQWPCTKFPMPLKNRKKSGLHCSDCQKNKKKYQVVFSTLLDFPGLKGLPGCRTFIANQDSPGQTQTTIHSESMIALCSGAGGTKHNDNVRCSSHKELKLVAWFEKSCWTAHKEEDRVIIKIFSKQ